MSEGSVTGITKGAAGGTGGGGGTGLGAGVSEEADLGSVGAGAATGEAVKELAAA